MSTTASTTSRFSSTFEDQTLSRQSAIALSGQDVGQQITAALAGSIDPDAITASEVVQVSLLVDDSSSISSAGNTQHVRDGHNIVLQALRGAKQIDRDSIIGQTILLNRGVLNPFMPLANMVEMNTTNYKPGGNTPLYDTSVVFLGSILAKAQEFANNGVPVRTVSLIITDGADCGSQHSDEHDVATIVGDMLRQESHIVAAMGIDDGSTDFYMVFSGVSRSEVEQARADGTIDSLKPRGGMGIMPKWVLTPGNSPHELRAAFEVFSQSAVRASQNAGSFSQAAMGGFGK